MFSLIITIVSVALVAALALATMYYGSSAFNKGADDAKAAQFVQEGNQVVGALELYRADIGALPTGTADEIKQQLLSSNYLTSWPSSEWEPRNDYVVRTGLSQTECLRVNQRLGISNVPQCTDLEFESRTVCCETP